MATVPAQITPPAQIEARPSVQNSDYFLIARDDTIRKVLGSDTLSYFTDLFAGLTSDYDSYAAAELATVTAAQLYVTVKTGTGERLVYRRDGSGTALTTGDGATWSPAGAGRPEHFGAATDASDNATALNAWLTWGAAGNVLVGSGTFDFQSQLTCPPATDFVLAGRDLTLNYTGASTIARMVQFGGPGLQSTRWNISGLRVLSETKMTAEVMVKFERVARLTLRDVRINGQDGLRTPWDGIWFDGCDTLVWDGYDVGNHQNDGIILSGVTGKGKAEYRISNGRVLYGGRAGLHIAGGVGGVYFEGDSGTNKYNILISNEKSSEANLELFLSENTIIDITRPGGYGIYIADGATDAENGYLSIDNPWIASGDEGGIYVASNVEKRIVITGGKIFNNGQAYWNGQGATLTTTGSITTVAGETITQASTGATGVVYGGGSGTRLILLEVEGTFNTTNQLTGSTSGALGANSVPTVVNTSTTVATGSGNPLGAGHGIHATSAVNKIEITGTLFEDNRGTAINQTVAHTPTHFLKARAVSFDGNGSDYSEYGRPESVIANDGIIQFIETQQTFGTDTAIELYGHGGSEGPAYRLRYAGGTISSKTVPSDGDVAGDIEFGLWDSNSWRNGALIRTYVDGTVSDGVTPMRMSLLLAAAGGTYPSILDLREGLITAQRLFVQNLTRAQFVTRNTAGAYADLNDGIVANVEGCDYVFEDGATEIPDLADWRCFGVVTPYHFASGVGQGTAATDVAAIQAALDTGHDVMLRPRPGDQFTVDDTLTTGAGGQRIYAPATSWGGDTPGGDILVTGGGTFTDSAVIRVAHTKVSIENISFEEDSVSAPGSVICIYALRTSNTDDLDVTVRGCNFVGNNFTMAHLIGRGTKFNFNEGNCNTGVIIEWPSSGIEGSGDQIQPYGHRGLEIIGNRFHGVATGACITLREGTSGDMLRGFKITDNTSDIPSQGFIDSDIELCHGTISGNISEMQTGNNICTAKVRSVTFSGNVWNGKREDEGESPENTWRFEGGLEDVTFVGDTFSHADARAIVSTGFTRNVTVSACKFYNIGQDHGGERGAVAVNDAWGLYIDNCTGHLMQDAFLVALGAVTSTTTYWRDVVLENLTHDGDRIVTARPGTTYVIDAGGNSFPTEPTVNTQSGTTYTLVLADASKLVEMNNASANTLTIPTNSSVAFTVGDVIEVRQKGAGVTTITAASGVTLNGTSAGSCDLTYRYGSVFLIKTATDAWVVRGDQDGVA